AGRSGGARRGLAPGRCGSLGDWLADLPRSDAPIALLGSGAAPHRAELEAALGARARFLPEAAGVLRARTVGRLGLRLAANGMACAPGGGGPAPPPGAGGRGHPAG